MNADVIGFLHWPVGHTDELPRRPTISGDQVEPTPCDGTAKMCAAPESERAIMTPDRTVLSWARSCATSRSGTVKHASLPLAPGSDMDVMLIGFGGQRAVGTEQSDRRSTPSYDLTAERLTSGQQAPEVFIPPYRGSPLPLGLLAQSR
jgi:hypothetical protein